MSIPGLSAAPSVEPAPQDAIDTISEAVTDWMKKYDIVDLTKLSSTQIKTLIIHLQSFEASGDIPGLNGLIKNLQSIELNHSNAQGTNLENYAAGVKMRAAVLNELGKVMGDESKAFVTAAKASEELVIALDQLINNIDGAAAKWSKKPEGIKEQIGELIKQIDGLKAAGVSTNELGLNSLAEDLQSALDSYTDATKVQTDLNSIHAQLALSNLREAFHQVKLEYLNSTGASPDDSGVAGAMAGVRSEQLRQTRLLSPSEDTTISPKNVSHKEIDKAMSDLDLQYQIAVSEGNKDAMAHIEAKMKILGRARDMLTKGDDPLLVGIVMFIGLRMLDISAKKVNQARLREQAVELQKKSDPNLDQQIAELTAQADALDAEIDALVKQISQVQDQYESVLNTWTQNTNEALSKAL